MHNISRISCGNATGCEALAVKLHLFQGKKQCRLLHFVATASYKRCKLDPLVGISQNHKGRELNVSQYFEHCARLKTKRFSSQKYLNR